jgi:hypothetical protein
MNILDIYKKFNINILLQEHMLRVAALGQLICKDWAGPKIDKDIITQVLLLHDLGNIVKIDFNKYIPEEKPNRDYWIGVQEQVINKYSSDDHLATFNMITELGVSEYVKWLAMNKIFINNEMTDVSKDFNLKICTYADQRVAPDKVMPLIERLNEVRERSNGNPRASINHPRSEQLLKSASNIEEQILQYTKVDKFSDVNDEVNKIMEELKGYEVPVEFD